LKAGRSREKSQREEVSFHGDEAWAKAGGHRESEFQGNLPCPPVVQINEERQAGMLPLQGRFPICPRPRAALALALGYGIQPRRGLRAAEKTHPGSAKGAAIPQPGPEGREPGFVTNCGLKGRDPMPFGHH
jgi:hypothetical protein